MEMRGGTDLLIMHNSSKHIPNFPVSSVGYSEYKSPVDIMIPDNDREHLERDRGRIKSEGLDPEEIFDTPKNGHWYFTIDDPELRGHDFIMSP